MPQKWHFSTSAVKMETMTEQIKRILLFDIDGTLLNPADIGRTCFRRALEDVYGITPKIDGYDLAGKTDWLILTDLMRAAGIEDEEIDAHREAAFTAYSHHVEVAAPAFNMHLLPGVEVLLDHLSDSPDFIMGLVTGNVREAVPHKLRKVGINPGIFKFGAFGNEHPDRNTLPALALYRLSQMLGSQPEPETAIIIGDTPLDIACARHAGVKELAVTTGHFDREALAAHQPDYLLDDLSDLDQVMDVLRGY